VTEADLPKLTVDPDGRTVAFTDRTWHHIGLVRPELLDEVDAIIAAVARPDIREPDPRPGRERFYRRHATDRIRWMRVVVDFNRDPAVIVTAFIQRKNPTNRLMSD
jgi:hypothetical protein